MFFFLTSIDTKQSKVAVMSRIIYGSMSQRLPLMKANKKPKTENVSEIKP